MWIIVRSWPKRLLLKSDLRQEEGASINKLLVQTEKFCAVNIAHREDQLTQSRACVEWCLVVALPGSAVEVAPFLALKLLAPCQNTQIAKGCEA